MIRPMIDVDPEARRYKVLELVEDLDAGPLTRAQLLSTLDALTDLQRSTLEVLIVNVARGEVYELPTSESSTLPGRRIRVERVELSDETKEKVSHLPLDEDARALAERELLRTLLIRMFELVPQGEELAIRCRICRDVVLDGFTGPLAGLEQYLPAACGLCVSERARR